jgi:hypothetical protein
MPIIYRTAGAWGPGKGSDLNAVEIDGNFANLDGRIQALIDNPPSAVGVSNIVIEGLSVLFYMTDGSTYGPFPLPYVTFRIRAAFDSSVASSYDAMDLIPVDGLGLFLVRFNHDYAIGEAFDPALMSGTDPVYIKVFGEDPYIYDFGFFYPGKPGVGIEDGFQMAGHLPARDIYLPAGLPGSKASLKVAPTAALSFNLLLNADVVGTLDFAIGETAGTFTLAADAQLIAADGDAFYLDKPSAIDDTAKQLTVTFIARQGQIGS